VISTTVKFLIIRLTPNMEKTIPTTVITTTVVVAVAVAIVVNPSTYPPRRSGESWRQ
jgi:hypothetical protein